MGPRNAPFDFPLTLNNFSKYEVIILLYNNCTLKLPFYILLLVFVSFFLFLLTINKNRIISVHRCINRVHME